MFNIKCSMFNKLLFQNIKVAWRNLMKYKVQNIIAVLCLAVGLVCFSATFIFTQRAWESRMRKGDYSNRVWVALYKQKDSLVHIGPDILQRVNEKHLPSIQTINIDDLWLGAISSFTDLEGKTHAVDTKWRLISPEHLNFMGYRSAITGKRIPVLKPGDILMSQGMLERTFGKGVNPVGFTTDERFNRSNSPRPVIDVVDTGDWMLTEDYLYVVTDQLKEFLPKDEDPYAHDLYINNFYVILQKGKTAKDLEKELKPVFPEYKVTVGIGKDHRANRLLVKELLAMALFGSSVLLIGLFGFLKTQIQLFRLRQREMGLRQCMGAQRSQLFGLMMWEVGIVFFFVTLLTWLLTSLLVDFSLPIITKLASNFTVNMARTYATEFWICLATFLATVAIAALSVRKVITTPLSEVVGKSRKNSTRGRSLLIVLQMVICQLFLYLILGSVTYSEIEAINNPANEDDFRKCIVTNKHEWNFDFLDSVPQLQHIENFTSTVTLTVRHDLQDHEMPPRRFWVQTDRENNNQRFYTGQALLTDEHIFEILNLEVQSEAQDDEIAVRTMIPIFAPTERAAQLREKVGVKALSNPEHRIIEKGKEAECIGYFDGTVFTSLSWYDFTPEFLYVSEPSYFAEHFLIDFRVREDFENADTGWSLLHYVILQPKQGQYKEAVKELTDFYHRRGKYTLAKAPLDNLYDVCFKELRMLELFGQIVTVLTFVALLCIVLTLFSSVSLDTRGRQKEVAIRKVHGAGMKQIMWLFGKQYFWQLIVSSIISLFFCVAFVTLIVEEKGKIMENVSEMLIPYFYTVLIITIITFLTVGYKIYKVSKLNPATIIKKE